MLKLLLKIALIAGVALLFANHFMPIGELNSDKQFLEQECSVATGQQIEIGTFHYTMVERTLTDYGQYNADNTLVKGAVVLTDQARLPLQNKTEQKVYFPKTEEEASLLVKCANKLGKQISVRGGGHEYNGASLQGDIVIATRDIKLASGDDIRIEDNNTLVVNTNVRFGNMYKKLYQLNPEFNFVAGSCPTVVIGGYTLAGGHGTMTSHYGLAAHYLKEVRMITPEGEIKDINDETDAEYMKNLRGAGHNLGIALQYTFDYSSIPQHTWHFALYEGNINAQQYVETLEQYEKAVRDNKHHIAQLTHMGGGAVGQSLVRVFAFSPSNEMTLEQLKQDTQQQFPHLHLVPGSDLESKPYYEVITYDIPAVGQISVEYGMNQLINGVYYQNNLIYNSYQSAGIRSEGLVEKIQTQYEMGWMPWSGTNNYRYRQTGPYAEKSMYHPVKNSENEEVIFLTQITGGDMNQNQFPQQAYKTVEAKYPNYPPTFGKLTEEMFYQDRAQEVRDFKAKIDPENKFAYKFDILRDL